MIHMFSLAEKLYAAWLKDKAGNIKQFLPFFGVKHFLFPILVNVLHLAPKTPKDCGYWLR